MAAEDRSHVWAPATHVRDLEEAAGSWLHSGPSLAMVAILGMCQLMEDLPLFLSLPLSRCFTKILHVILFKFSLPPLK